MSRTKKVAAAAEAAEKEITKATKAVETNVEKAVEKVVKAPAKKKVAPKKTAPKKPEQPAEAKVNFFVEFGGVQVSADDVIANVKASYGKDAKEISVYLKPEESKAYYVADGEESEMDVFFC